MSRSSDSLQIPVRDDAAEFSTFARGDRLVQRLGEVGVRVQGSRVLDLGAGFGSISIAAAVAGASQVLAVDSNKDRLLVVGHRARDRGIRVETKQANLLDPWDGPPIWDLALLIGVVEYAGLWSDAESPTELQRRVLSTAYAALRPGGTLVLGTKNRAWPFFLLRDVHTKQPLVNGLPRAAADKLSRCLSRKPYRHHLHGPNAWADLMVQVGFRGSTVYFPQLSYQFPLKLSRKPTIVDAIELRNRRMSDEERRASWGRFGTIKSLIMAAGASFGLQLSHSAILVANK